jgi:cyclopropane fatty-acyl-phospholipid synthase-like methyltransferase
MLFDRADREDRVAQHAFTGGMMPSHHLVRQYADLFAVEKEWLWSGTHYQRTADDWLANFDRKRERIEAILHPVTAMRRRCGCAVGAGASSRHQGCSATPTAANGASVTIG